MPAAPLAGPSGAQAPVPDHAGDTRLSDAYYRWSAAVRIDGVEAEVYKVEHGVDKTTAFIVAEEGKEFEILVKRDERPDHDESTILSIDGSPKMNDTFNGKRVSATEIRPFVFAPIALTDDPDEAVQDEKIIQGLGTIRLNFHRVVRQGIDKRQRHAFTDAPGQRLVDERCKKATMIPLPTGKARAKYKYIDSREDPLYSLIFQYRSRAILEAEGIVEALPAPGATPEEVAPAEGGTVTPSPPPPPVKPPCSTPPRGIKKRKSETMCLAESDSESEDAHDDLREKLARLEAELAVLRGNVKPEPPSTNRKKVKRELTTTQENVKVTEEDGRVVLELLDDD
ncbi:hypothetical protein C6P46_005414 [Rhodotorula mucilaginosa]|uniref:DUF7918 domain-containing protein n=1 Tax=Rhodotorula mucilaginosa TaxID=5537 RepID=A0A9P6W923_RHOMI|nr:hypothetical protein C6P46_005414 [Rhodotorula mucilaginosa]